MIKRIPLLLCAAVLLWTVSELRASHSNGGCAQCHVTHNSAANSDVPLWKGPNGLDAAPAFTVYSTPTFDALGTDIGQPDGASKLCLGCHDGSSKDISSNPDPKLTFAPADLALSHPVSFTYNSSLAARVRSGSLKDPSVALSGLGGTVQADLLDGRGKMQCTSCHDVHASGKGTALLRYDYNTAQGTDVILCRTCHNK
jgi:predicted CXXCH cytochrome family protein